MPTVEKSKFCKVCGDADILNLCITSNRGKIYHKNLCRKCRQDKRRGTYSDWTNGKVCRHCGVNKPIKDFSVPSNPNCKVCGGMTAKQRSIKKCLAFRKTDEGRKLRRLEDKTDAAKARHSRYNNSEKRKYAIANGLTAKARATCHPNRYSVSGGLCSQCLRNKQTKELHPSYIKQLIRSQYDRAGLTAPILDDGIVSTFTSIVKVRRLIKDIRK